ncbi:arginine--tRNA ligase, partial [Candidatus Kaiserbacteria bacterium]|nr:arginine--tRNA ligase [Candidatus Kaiserbacteria bacterium]
MPSKIKEAIHSALNNIGVDAKEITIEHPADLSHGDYATSIALQYAKQVSQSPLDFARKIVESLGTVPGVERIEIAGPGFINFHLTREVLNAGIDEARTESWGKGDLYDGKKVMVEYTDPNPFKEFHIGHLMSNAIGESISRLIEVSGAEVKRANYQGDVGPHVAKAMYAYIHHRPNIDNDVVRWGLSYKIGNELYESNGEARRLIDEINERIYAGDPDLMSLYKEGRRVSLDHFEELYKFLGTKFDFYFFESETAPRGLELIRKHPEVFRQSDGATVFDGSHTRVFITSKGLPTYEAKELGLAELKKEKFSGDIYLTITASEQDGFFEVVYQAIERILLDVSGKLQHHSHGMMRFAEGKMSSRQGNVITGEFLLQELIEGAKVRAAESRADNPAKLAEQVAVAAIKYQILKQASNKDIIFDRERALSLEGDSGPYLQYAHARAHQIV